MNWKAISGVVCFLAATYLGMLMFGNTPGGEAAKPKRTAAANKPGEEKSEPRSESQAAAPAPLPSPVSPGTAPPSAHSQPGSPVPGRPTSEPIEVPDVDPEVTQLARTRPKGRVRPPALEAPPLATQPAAGKSGPAEIQPNQPEIQKPRQPRKGMFYDAVMTAKKERPARVHIYNTSVGNVVILLNGPVSNGPFAMRGAQNGHTWEVRGTGSDITVTWDGKTVPPR